MRNRTWWASIFCTGDLPRTSCSFGSRLDDGFDALDFNVSHSGPFLFSHFFFVLILCVVANGLESTESWGGGGVCVDVKHVSPFNLLEKPHRGVSLIILDHILVGLSDSDIFSWVLENAPCSIGTFTWVLQEILTNWCKVLSAKGLFLLKFLLSVSKATALLFHLVFALKSLQPKSAKLSLHLLLPWTFIEVLPFKRAIFIHAWALSMFDWLTLTDLLRAYRRHELRNSVKRKFFYIRVAEAICWWSCGWSGLRSSLVSYMLTLGEFKVKHWNMFMLKALSWHFWRSCEILNTFGWDIDWDSNLLIRRGLESALSA